MVKFSIYLNRRVFVMTVVGICRCHYVNKSMECSSLYTSMMHSKNRITHVCRLYMIKVGVQKCTPLFLLIIHVYSEKKGLCYKNDFQNFSIFKSAFQFICRM